MNKYLLLILGVLFLAACSSPKYTYYFDHYDYNSGKKPGKASNPEVAHSALPAPELSALRIDEKALSASAEGRVEPVAPNRLIESIPAAEKEALAKEFASLSKSEKKELKKEVKAAVKEVIKAKKDGKDLESIAEKKAMDRDLKMALIFGVVAIVLGALSGAGSVFWILSVIALVVAIVFFIQWLARQ